MISLNKAELAFDAFDFIKTVPETAIFGGFMRDMVTGRTPKDLDMLVTESKKNDLLMEFVKKGWSVNPLLDSDHENFDPNYSSNNFLVEVIKCYPPMASREEHRTGNFNPRNRVKMRPGSHGHGRLISVDILVISCDPEFYIQNLPIGSSQIGFTANGLIQGPLFEDFFQHKVLTFGHNIRQNYIDRLLNYYNNPQRRIVRTSTLRSLQGEYSVRRIDDNVFFERPEPRDQRQRARGFGEAVVVEAEVTW